MRTAKIPTVVSRRTMPDGPVKGERVVRKAVKAKKYRISEGGKMKY